MKSHQLPISLALFAFLFSVYMLSGSGIIDSKDTAMRLAVSRSLLDRGDLAIDRSSFSVAAQKFIVRGRDGRWYSLYNLGQSILMLPFCFLGDKYFANPETASMLNQIVVAGIAVILFLFIVDLGYRRRTALLLSLAFGLGTMAWPYAKTSHEAPLEVLFVFCSFWLMGRYQLRRSPRWLLFSGLSFGMAIFVRSPAVIAAPGLLLYLTISGQETGRCGRALVRKTSIWSSSILPLLAAVLWYNYYRFGSVIETGSTVGAPLSSFFTTPLITGMRGLLLSPGKSLFLYSPITILFIPSIVSFFRKRKREALSFSLLMVTYILFYAKLVCWHGDWAWGPRYLLVLIPFTMVPLAESMEGTGRRGLKAVRAAGIFLFFLGLLVQLAAVSVDYNSYFYRTGLADYHRKSGKEFFHYTDRPYFDPRYSPILHQFRYALQAVGAVRDRPLAFERSSSTPPPHLDFWWMYDWQFEYPAGGKALILGKMLVWLFLGAVGARELVRTAFRTGSKHVLSPESSAKHEGPGSVSWRSVPARRTG